MRTEKAVGWLLGVAGGCMAVALAIAGSWILWSLARDTRIQVCAWMALLLPLAGFVVLGLFGGAIKRDREERGAGWLACGAVVGAFVMAATMAVTFAGIEAELRGSIDRHEAYLAQQGVEAGKSEEILGRVGKTLELTPYFPSDGAVSLSVDWIRVGSVQLPFALLIDRLSLLLMLIVTGVGALIHIYSLGYMAHDPERVRYFSYLNLFTFFMLLLVMAGHLPLLFVGWEGVGLCSYLLIGFWFKKTSAADAGKKAFLVNRIGDAALIVGMILTFHVLGTLDLVRLTDAARGVDRSGVTQQVAALAPEALGTFGPLTVIALLLFIGACGKSAQIPLHVWLPDAMEGPTPVSALIHAATMVTAGVYLVARLSPLYAKSATALAVVAAVGLATALMAGTVALVQTDIKRVLAYSTISQLGFMFLACGMGFFGAAVYHLFTHAFFKALLFLGAGAVIHALGGEQDMRRMGGLRRLVPWTFWTFLAGTAAIAGVPYLSGYMSKEEILAGTLAAGHPWHLALALGAATLTAFYMGRLLFLTFFGTFRGSDEARQHVHEAPWVMRVPLILLAVGAVGAGYVVVSRLLAPVVAPHVAETHAAWLAPLSTLLAAAAVVAAGYLYLEYVDVVPRLRARLAPVASVLDAKWGFDLAFNWLARRVVVEGSSRVLWQRVDAGLIDGAVNATARLVDRLAERARAVQTGLVREYALVLFGGAVVLLAYLVWR